MLLLQTEKLPDGKEWLYELSLTVNVRSPLKPEAKFICGHAMIKISMADTRPS